MTSNSIVLRWRTDEATDSQVRLGFQTDSLAPVVYDSALTNDHELTLGGLIPDARYYYAVGSSTENFAGGPDCYFLTAPAGEKRVRIWVTGDTRATIFDPDGDSRQYVRDAYLAVAGELPADLWLHTGDIANTGQDVELQTAFFDVYAPLLRHTPVYPCLGNHDLGTGQGQAYLDSFSLPTNSPSRETNSGMERYYSFNYADIHFVVLDAYGPDLMALEDWDPDYLATELDWLQADLMANTQKWLITMFHPPPYTHGSHNSDWEWDSFTVRTNFAPVLESFGVDLVINGHSHSYERSYLLNGHYDVSSTLTEDMMINNGDGRAAGTGPYYKPDRRIGAVYVVVGSSGFLGGGSFDHPAMFYSGNVLGSLLVDVQGDVLQARFIDSNAQILDHFTIIKGAQPPRPRITSVSIRENQLHLAWETVQGWHYQLHRREGITQPRQPVGDALLADSFQLEWSESLDPERPASFFEVELVLAP